MNKIASFYTTNELKPTGWLRKQLKIQAEGLSGNLDKVWPDIRDSKWIGGDKDGWERVPYWLDGFIPLAWLLDDEDLKARAKRYINGIIAQQKEDGWICPCADENRAGYDMWAAILIAKVLTVYIDCTNDEKAYDSLYRLMQNLSRHIDGRSLFNWGSYRAFEAMIALNWLMDRDPQPWMEELAVTIKSQGADYKALFDCWKDQIPKYRWRLQTHVVNLSMALKSQAVYWRVQEGNGNDDARKMARLLEEYHGMPIGHFTGDECLAGTSPVHGTELCGVAEAMYSCEVLYSITKDSFWLDKLEALAYNAFPATNSKDMWTHQYLQSANQTVCRVFDITPVWYTNGPEANLFGLEPNFGCCTANFNQAWPKLALSAFMKESENVIISALTLPCALHTKVNDVGTVIEVSTDYPFRDKVKYTVTTEKAVELTLKIHVPSGCLNVTINGKEQEICSGFTSFTDVFEGVSEINVEFGLKPVLVQNPSGLYSVKRGALVFSLPVKSESSYTEYERNGVERKFPYCDYQFRPVSSWNYGFSEDSAENALVEEHPLSSEFPFSEEEPAMTLEMDMTKIDWGSHPDYPELCNAYPNSNKAIQASERIKLIPYGCTVLRMTEMPIVQKAEKREGI